MSNTMKEIQSPAEVKVMVDAFYDKVNKDELLSYVFNNFAGVDWEKHLPVMYSFWESMLLGNFTYKGNPFLKHVPLPVEKAHFNRWLQLFEETVDEYFTGEKAQEAKQRARSIAAIFQQRLAMLKE